MGTRRVLGIVSDGVAGTGDGVLSLAWRAMYQHVSSTVLPANLVLSFTRIYDLEWISFNTNTLSNNNIRHFNNRILISVDFLKSLHKLSTSYILFFF